jgi:hypothetical protein
MSYDLIESTLIRLGEQMPEHLSPSLGYAGMSSSNAERYLKPAEDCCRRAVIAEDVEQCSHWLEAAARWFSLAREQRSQSFSAQAASRLSFSSAS